MIDVLIVGGGPAGLTLAILLTRAGLTVRVVEARDTPQEHSRAIGLHPPAVDVLHAAGIAKEAIASGVPIRRGLGLSSGRRIAALDFDVLTGRHPFILSLPQATTTELLTARLRELDPQALLVGHALTTFRQDDRGIHATMTGRPAPITARYLVGADGVGSTVRPLAGLPFAGSLYPDHYVMGDYPDTTGFGATAALLLHPEGIVESFPLPGGLRRWVAWHRPADATTLPSLIERRTGYRVDPDAATMHSRFRCSHRAVAQMVHGRVILIGDAAHEISPIGGQGMALGLLDAAALAPLLTRAGTKGSTPADLLAGFSRDRLRAAARAGRQAHLNMALGRPLPRVLDQVRAAAITAVARSKPLTDAVAHRFTMSRGFR
ncbi:MAG: FAD-dependent oxidoreductase [Arthrobacter sp.]|uniref:FAD-dependent oxidoreductase n=1 Tax=unclassified Arthrobacter TaxID=235627 RepID=UPI00264F49BC|nr:FAD-dependent monooxygenase [Micrococcaceae bacterium]MDN5813023.1 FAD-dependent monooxygenase [Micrococcaceae bacterium]MDN5823488.1 FAD-dependent monooxygenase [Micrococcaceae bacterium]MDN5905512.1 FAD-dependent monooxygenase [Micrococcaceae bacterium]